MLPRAELPGDVEDHGDVQAAAAGPGIARQAPPRDPQHTAGLGSGRCEDPDLPAGCRNGRDDAERGVGWLDVQVVPQIGPDPGEPGVRAMRMVTYASPAGRQHDLPEDALLSERPIADTEVHLLLDGLCSSRSAGSPLWRPVMRTPTNAVPTGRASP